VKTIIKVTIQQKLDHVVPKLELRIEVFVPKLELGNE